jgi:hypothetical protein
MESEEVKKRERVKNERSLAAIPVDAGCAVIMFR